VTLSPRHSHEAGVSLIEVLAALAIVALMGAIAVVMLDARRTALDVSAERLTRALAEARQEALLSGQVIGFSAAPDFRGWAFHEYRAGRWRVIADHPALETVRLPDGLTLEARAGAIASRTEDTSADIPQVWFDPTGFDAPFTYVLADDEDYRIVARLDDGRVRLSADEVQALAEFDQ
jgi:type II secretion system protein H